MYEYKQRSRFPDIQRQNIGHYHPDSCSSYDWDYTCSLWVSASFCRIFCCLHYFYTASTNLQHLHSDFWVADSHFHLRNLDGQKLGLDWHRCSSFICYRGGCLHNSKFAQHPRHSKISCRSRSRLRSCDLVIPVSKARESPIQVFHVKCKSDD